MRALFMSVVRSVPTTAGSGVAKIHVSPWNMLVTAQNERVVALGKEIVNGPLSFMETTITGLVYLDMLQQFLIPQLDEHDQ
jgi:hypothetical protein